MEIALKETYFLDHSSKEIQELVHEFRGKSTFEIIEQLYIKVRDSWRYNAYVIGIEDKDYVASNIYHKKEAHCIDKAILYTAGLRALGIPSKLRLAKVSNHIAVERLVNKLGTNELAPHGLVEVYNGENWVKCSPAFNKELCALYNVAPLDFNGKEDAIMQEYNNDNAKFMQYLEDYGSFDDVPLEFIKETFKNQYPTLFAMFQRGESII